MNYMYIYTFVFLSNMVYNIRQKIKRNDEIGKKTI